jgi:hypothetical protein
MEVQDIIQGLLKSKRDNDFNDSHGTRTIFSLTYKWHDVGVLTYNNAYWTFQYSESFINQDKYAPLFEF